jgi:hypothetical protein
MRIFTPEEARQQTVADGLISISIPEKVPEGAFDELNPPQNGMNERPSMLGKPIAPSQGGYGEVKSELELSNILEQNF